MKYSKGLVVGLIVCSMILSAASFVFAAGGRKEVEKYPSRNIEYVIPFNPGGQSDITAQYQKEDLQKELGVNVVIKHMPGAGGAVACAIDRLLSRHGAYTIRHASAQHPPDRRMASGEPGRSCPPPGHQRIENLPT